MLMWLQQQISTLKEMQAMGERPCKSDQRTLVLVEAQASYLAINGERRMYLDVIMLKDKLAVKIAVKSPERRSFVRIPVIYLKELTDCFCRVTQAGASGKKESTKREEMASGRADENRLFVEETKLLDATMAGVAKPKETGEKTTSPNMEKLFKEALLNVATESSHPTVVETLNGAHDLLVDPMFSIP
ncbi:hypothetical protein H6P81_016389 [Aristolochia fimbriata]|uniref:Uncharacterized protein n=1 Tax=Aristolochia fimbriata TaxID=158543 RepID=A0AAV7E8U9_ARIFI|nr:hypothetical protein H6P81_016389 [Aristolochia fimbriata]